MILTTDTEFTISETNIPAKPPALEQLADAKIPEPAPLKPTPVLEAEPVDEQTSPAVSNEKPAEPAATPVTEQTTASVSPPQPTTTKSDKDARAWVVQVASFSEQDKALKLRDRLRKAKYPTFVESVTTNSNKLYRVRVGPVVRRENADEWQKKIARDFKLPDALVMAHPG